MKIRFMDNFLQLYNLGRIYDVRRVNHVWQEFKEEYERTKDFDGTCLWCEKRASEYMLKVRETYKTIRKVRHYDDPKSKKYGGGYRQAMVEMNMERKLEETKENNNKNVQLLIT